MTTLAWDEVFDCAVAAWCRSSTSQEMLRMCFQSRTQQNEVSVGWTANELMAFATGIARLAAAPTPPAEQQAKDSYIKLLADCRDAFPVPEHGSPIENEWIAAVGSHEAVPAYLQAVAKQQAAQKAAAGEPTGKQSLQVQVWVLPNGKGGGQFSWEPQDERFWTKLVPQQGAQEPSKAYAWVYVNKYGVDSIPASKDWCATMVSGHGGSMFPLYTAPQPAPVVGRMSPSKEWLETRLAIADDSDVQAGVPSKNARPCDAPPGCDSHNCHGCDDFKHPSPTPQPAPAPLSDDTERLEWLLWKLPGDALRYVVGELSDTSSGAEFRAAIDAAIAAQGGKV